MTDILLVDSGLEDRKALLDALRPGLRVVEVTAVDDGVAMLADALAQRPPAVHILAHGAPGEIRLGARAIDAAALADRSWPDASGTRILIHACRVAEGEAGGRFVARLAAATGAEVAASTRMVGGGDGASWALDVATAAAMTAATPFAVAPVWPHALAITGTPTPFPDLLIGDGENDTVDALAGDDTVDGGAGDDLIVGGIGNDVLLGGLGRDTLVGGAGADQLDGGIGFDFASYLQSTEGIVLDLVNPAANTGDAAGDTFADIELYEGSNFNDVFVGSAGNEWFWGHNGADSIFGGDGNDTLEGGSGIDTIDGGAGDDLLYGRDDPDLLLGGMGNDTLEGNGHGDTLAGGSGDDLLVGDPGNGQGVDVALFSGAAADYRFVANADGTITVTDTVANRDGVDTLSHVESVQFGDGVAFSFGPNNSEVFQQVIEGSGQTLLVPGAAYSGPVASLQREFVGTAAGEVIAGTNANDFINGLDGNDAIAGGAGNDVIDGGRDSNFLSGGTGTDVFFLDGRSASTTWSTITDWEAREQLSVCGFRPGVSTLTWVQQDGVAGFTGLTMHGDLNGDGAIDTSVTWSGLTDRSQLPAAGEFDGLLWFT